MSSASTADLAGTYAFTKLQTIRYGPGSIKHLPDLVQKLSGTKAMILTGRSLMNKTDVISKIEKILGDKHATTFSEIGQHAPVEHIKKGLEKFKDSGADIIIAVGGGSPIDSAKVLSHFHKEYDGSYINHIAVPTTLSAAEFAANAGYSENNKKTGVKKPELVPAAIIMDAELSLATPEELWLSTGIRALDHAVECLYRKYVPPPVKELAYVAIRELFHNLKECKRNPNDVDTRQKLQLAAWQSYFPYSQETEESSGLGLSHNIGYALGSPYSIPHGTCSCISLGPVIRWQAKYATQGDKESLARALSYIGEKATGDLNKDVLKLADAIDGLVRDLGLDKKLSDFKVPKDDLDKIVTTGGLKDDKQKQDMIKELEAKL